MTEREELVGRLREGSRLPQYLDIHLSELLEVCMEGASLDHRDVHRGRRTRSIDLLILIEHIVV